MECINGILILTPEEKDSLESVIGPLTSYSVHDVRLKLVNEVEKKEAQGYLLWAKLIRALLEDISAFAGAGR